MQFSQALQSVIWLDCSQLNPTDVDPLPHPHSKWQSVVGGGWNMNVLPPTLLREGTRVADPI